MGDSENQNDTAELQTALWVPAWHELDQSLSVGVKQKFYFYDALPSELEGADGRPVFFNGVDSTENCLVQFAEVVKILHPTIGEILRVDTFGLDYIIYPVDGEEIVVDAEENPGEINSGNLESVSDWTLQVTIRPDVI